MAEHDISFRLKGLWIRFDPAGKSYLAVEGINLNIKCGKVLGLVGEPGYGKNVTMLFSMDLLLKNNREITGNVLFDGQELNKLPDRKFQKIHGKHIFMVFQEPMTSLNPVFTMDQQFSEVLEQHLNMTEQANRTKCLELLNLVPIPDLISVYDYYPFKLSGDMRQCVTIAMALTRGPGLIIADEPATALDVTTQAWIIDLSKELQKKLNTTIIFTSRDLGVVDEISDNAAVLHADYMMEEYDIKTLFCNPLHPYTFGLMGFRMRRSPKNKGKLYNIPGMVPSTKNMPAGCPFVPRCLEAGGQHIYEIPSLVEMEPDHKVRCWEVADHVEATD